jgi:hypothetical protein
MKNQDSESCLFLLYKVGESMTNRMCREKLNLLYGCRCLLTNIKTKNELTFHHLLKEEYGGRATIENGANLINTIHEWLHNEIEPSDKELFNLINECLELYKKCLDKGLIDLSTQYEQECMPLFYQSYLRYKK